MARGVYVGAGGSATATANVSANGGAGSATAQAVGGASAIAAGAAVASSSVSDATSGLAQATARMSDGAGDEVIARAGAPVGGPASANAVPGDAGPAIESGQDMTGQDLTRRS